MPRRRAEDAVHVIMTGPSDCPEPSPSRSREEDRRARGELPRPADGLLSGEHAAGRARCLSGVVLITASADRQAALVCSRNTLSQTFLLRAMAVWAKVTSPTAESRNPLRRSAARPKKDRRSRRRGTIWGKRSSPRAGLQTPARHTSRRSDARPVSRGALCAGQSPCQDGDSAAAIEHYLEAIRAKEGAYDYLPKPFRPTKSC